MMQTLPINRRLKIVLILAASQAFCLAVGFWLQYRFVLVLAQWNTRTAAVQTSEVEANESPPVGDDGTYTVDTVESLRQAINPSLPFAFIWIAGLQSVAAYLVLTHLQTEHNRKQTKSKEASLVKAKELLRTRDTVIFGLAKLAESRDPDTGHHLDRISLYSSRLATAIHQHPRYRDLVTMNFVRSIRIGSVLHDIGKVGIPDSILLKAGKLDSIERSRMQKHTTIGGECIRQIEQRLGNSSFLAMAREIAYCHHERWDGTGYPANLRGAEIPLAARIVAIADVYDALASRRTYKEAFPHAKCVEIIREESGTHFDPYLVDVFLSIEKQFESISRRFRQDNQLDTDTCRADDFEYSDSHDVERFGYEPVEADAERELVAT